MNRPDLRSLSLTDLQKSFKELGQPAYRAAQVYDWFWKLGAKSIDDMTNVPVTLRELLKEIYTFNSIKLDVQQNSLDGTVKARYILHDGHKIESVLIPVTDDKRATACVSSQVG